MCFDIDFSTSCCGACVPEWALAIQIDLFIYGLCQELSSKFGLLHSLLQTLRKDGNGERVLVVSNWTRTLDLVEKLCVEEDWPIHRLDGRLKVGGRLRIVDDFNNPKTQEAFVFLLSSKAGGCGLNITGASRLVMMDCDWNPANDRQAMARIWREGQDRPCFIYRLFSAGTVDEVVLQRQLCKHGLSSTLDTEGGAGNNIACSQI
jgi:DNA repair and recombination RAD54-like protein